MNFIWLLSFFFSVPLQSDPIVNGVPFSHAAEYNIIYDYLFPQERAMAFKYSDKSYYPARMSYSKNFKHIAPTQVYTPSPIITYVPPESAKFVMSDDISPVPQSIIQHSKSGWGPWKPINSCCSGCLASSKGLRLVQRDCESGTCNSGSVSSVQLSYQINRVS